MPRATLRDVTDAPPRPPIEPLFAHTTPLWLRVWAVAQGVALAVGCAVAYAAAGRPLLHARALVVVAMLIAYHVVGFRAHAWLLGRRWAMFAFVPLGWVLVLQALSIHGAFGLLVVGAVIQGFVFLPFRGAMAALALVVALLAWALAPHGGQAWTSLVTARLAGVAATGTMIATVLLYIHRANRDAAVRARLLAQLDAAQRDLAERAREAGVQDERQRLARDIHDTLAQGFTSVIRHLEAAQLLFDGASAPADAIRAARPHLTHARDMSRTSLAEIRRLVWALRPTPLDDAPLAAAVARIARQWGAEHGVPVTCTADPLPALDPEADVVFVRATQEALSNVARHAHATRVTVALHCVDGLAMLVVEDDGRGFPGTEPEAAPAAGLGLTGMRERVRPFGGHVLVESAVHAGTSVTVALPLAAVGRPAPNGVLDLSSREPSDALLLG